MSQKWPCRLGEGAPCHMTITGLDYPRPNYTGTSGPGQKKKKRESDSAPLTDDDLVTVTKAAEETGRSVNLFKRAVRLGIVDVNRTVGATRIRLGDARRIAKTSRKHSAPKAGAKKHKERKEERERVDRSRPRRDSGTVRPLARGMKKICANCSYLRETTLPSNKRRVFRCFAGTSQTYVAYRVGRNHSCSRFRARDEAACYPGAKYGHVVEVNIL